jgi:hypothetical protein
MVTIDNHTMTYASSFVVFPTWVKQTTCHTTTNSTLVRDRHGVTRKNTTRIAKGHGRHRADGCASRREKH